MARTVVYCASSDVQALFTQINMPDGLAVDTYVEAACNEVDSIIGYRYVVPVQVNTDDPQKVYGTQLLKTCTSQVAAGRLILAMGTAGEDVTIHQYGKYLLERGLSIACQIKDGDLNISFGVTNTDEGARKQGPILVGGDAFSSVDRFYHNMEPNGFLGNRPAPQGTSWPTPS